MESTRRVLGHSLVRLLVRSHCSLICLLCTACFARALHCTHLFACSLTLLTPKLVGKCVILSQNYLILNYSAISPAQQTQILTLTSLSDCGRCVALRIDSNSHAAQARTSVVREDETRVLLNCSYKKDETHVLINCVLINRVHIKRRV